VIRAVVGEVAEQLGNTPAVARSAYIDPRVLDGFLGGVTIEQTLERPMPLAELGERRRRRIELALLRLLD
jgi:DNA topoisomerase IB